MSRNPQLEAIFKARYAWENSTRTERQVRLQEYLRLLDEALVKAGLNPNRGARCEMEDVLFERYREFRHAKRHEERARLSRIR